MQEESHRPEHGQEATPLGQQCEGSLPPGGNSQYEVWFEGGGKKDNKNSWKRLDGLKKIPLTGRYLFGSTGGQGLSQILITISLHHTYLEIGMYILPIQFQNLRSSN